MDHWKTLHKDDETNKFENFVSILNQLKNSPSCPCHGHASKYFLEMLGFSDNVNFENDFDMIRSTFLKIKSTMFFFIHYHNLINVKLGKCIFF
jgi:hypothetical protein